jgi:hypothetical protein
MENIKLTPEEFLLYLRSTNYNYAGLRNIKMFKGKHLIITGDLNLNSLPIGGTLYDMTVEGHLNFSNTQINFIKDVESTKLTYYNTPYNEHLERLRKLEQLRLANERRQEGVWDINDTDEEGEMANACFEYAVMEGNIEKFDQEDLERLAELQSRIEALENEREHLDLNNEFENEKDTELFDLITELDDEITEIEEGKTDVYDFVKEGTHWSLETFRSLSTEKLYAVGDEDMVQRSLEDYIDSILDDVKNYFDNSYLEQYVDGDEVANYFEESERENIWENPENYNIERSLSSDQEEEIWLLEMEKDFYERFGGRPPIYEPTQENSFNVFDFTDIDDNRFEYKYDGNNWILYKNKKLVQPFQLYDDQDTEEIESEREDRISDIENEIDDIKENPNGDFDEDSVEEVLEDLLDEIRNYPVDKLRDYGYEDFSEFIDLDKLADHLRDEYDASDLNSYDSSYEEIKINGTWYTVFRLD